MVVACFRAASSSALACLDASAAATPGLAVLYAAVLQLVSRCYHQVGGMMGTHLHFRDGRQPVREGETLAPVLNTGHDQTLTKMVALRPHSRPRQQLWTSYAQEQSCMDLSTSLTARERECVLSRRGRSAGNSSRHLSRLTTPELQELTDEQHTHRNTTQPHRTNPPVQPSKSSAVVLRHHQIYHNTYRHDGRARSAVLPPAALTGRLLR